MISTVTNALHKEYDLCVVGSGPAGMILALDYSQQNPDRIVLLIEYGYKNQASTNSLDDSIQIQNLTNHHAPYDCTNKGVGGTSATWGGRCVMYDEVDFIDRPILEGGCTWDETILADASQYLARTSAYFECGEPVFSLHNSSELSKQPIAEGFREDHITDSGLERWSMPTRFGDRYAGELRNRPNLIVVEGCEVRELGQPGPDGIVDSLTVRDVRTGQVHTVRAGNIVLAAGAQESTRLLLRNQHILPTEQRAGSVLGKYYQSHLSGKIASIRFYGDARKTEFGFQQMRDGTYVRRRFQFTMPFLAKRNLLNTVMWLDNPLYYDPSHRSGPMSFMYLAMITPFLGKWLAPPAIAYSVTKGKVTGLVRHVGNIVRQFPRSLTTPAAIFYRRYLPKRKLPGVFLYSPDNRYALHFHAEQIPQASNRMELGPDGETLVIHYDLSAADIKSVIELHEELDSWLRQCNCGELEYWFPKADLPDAIRAMSRDGIHQLGTTRIADTPEQGVVDRNLKVWGTANVYVCSSSVFPTSGQANPTFFLGAMAIRLARHLSCCADKK